MSMDDWGWSEAEAKSETAPAVLEAGRHVAQITSAKWERKERVPEKWAERNPEGWRVALVLTVHSQGRKYQLFADVPRHWRWLFERICDATGTALPSDSSWQPLEWVGRDVEIETTVWESNNGPRAQVEKWFAHEAESKPAAKRPARTGAAKVAAARGDEPGGEDDIPFMWLLPFVLAAATVGGIA